MVPWIYQFEGPRNSQIRSEEKKSLKMESIMFHINVISSHEYQKDIAKQSKEKGEEKKWRIWLQQILHQVDSVARLNKSDIFILSIQTEFQKHVWNKSSGSNLGVSWDGMVTNPFILLLTLQWPKHSFYISLESDESNHLWVRTLKPEQVYRA